MIDYLGIILCAIASLIFGSIWYGPLFGNQWMKLMKIAKPKKITPAMKKMMMKSYSIMFIGSIVTATVLSFTIVKIYPLYFAWFTTALLWLGFMVPMMTGSVIWEGKPWKLFFLNSFYQLINLIISATILYFI